MKLVLKMNLIASTVTLFLSAIVCANSQSHGIPVAAPKKIGSVYLVPVFLPNQEDQYSSTGEIINNKIDNEYYGHTTPLHQIVLGYPTSQGTPYESTGYDQVPSIQENFRGRQKRSPGGGKGGGGGGGGGRGGGRSGSWSQSSASSSSGSWGGGSGRGGGLGGGKGKGYGK